MANTIKLKNLANISSGYSFRSSLKDNLGKAIKVLQAKDIKDGYINYNNIQHISDPGFKNNYSIQKGDVLLSSRGLPKAGLVDQQLQNTVGSSSVYIIRVNSSKILPKYLSIFLNSLIGQKQLNERATGAAISTILKRELEDIEIYIPSLEKQQQIIDMYENNQKLQVLLKRKALIIDKINQTLINKLINS